MFQIVFLIISVAFEYFECYGLFHILEAPRVYSPGFPCQGISQTHNDLTRNFTSVVQSSVDLFEAFWYKI